MFFVPFHSRRLLALVVGVVVLSAALFILALPGPKVGKLKAYTAAAALVAGQLYDPSAANFGVYVIDELEPNRWRIYGDLDASDSSGKILHKRYACQVVYHGADKWELAELSVRP